MTVESHGRNGIIQRAIDVLAKPKETWMEIAAEPSSVSSIFKNYLMILALAPAAASLIAGLVGFMFATAFGGGAGAVVGVMGLMAVIVGAIFLYGFTLLCTWLMSLLINALAPTFGSSRDTVQAFKVAAYSATPGLVAAAIAEILGIVPFLGAFLGFLIGLAAWVYAIYQIYLGLKYAMGSPDDKAVGYTATVVGIAFAVGLVIFLVFTMVAAIGLVGAGVAGAFAY